MTTKRATPMPLALRLAKCHAAEWAVTLSNNIYAKGQGQKHWYARVTTRHGQSAEAWGTTPQGALSLAMRAMPKTGTKL